MSGDGADESGAAGVDGGVYQGGRRHNPHDDYSEGL